VGPTGSIQGVVTSEGKDSIYGIEFRRFHQASTVNFNGDGKRVWGDGSELPCTERREIGSYENTGNSRSEIIRSKKRTWGSSDQLVLRAE